MFVVCYSLSVVCYLLFAVWHLQVGQESKLNYSLTWSKQYELFSSYVMTAIRVSWNNAVIQLALFQSKSSTLFPSSPSSCNRCRTYLPINWTINQSIIGFASCSKEKERERERTLLIEPQLEKKEDRKAFLKAQQTCWITPFLSSIIIAMAIIIITIIIIMKIIMLIIHQDWFLSLPSWSILSFLLSFN